MHAGKLTYWSKLSCVDSAEWTAGAGIGAAECARNAAAALCGRYVLAGVPCNAALSVLMLLFAARVPLLWYLTSPLVCNFIP